ncbi:hypothetical protein PIB30_047058 [Stylosanthes scabra]|uniref:Uncharacterized protein n=1 Tax=Stylosanthes scabra TaxID=79078 RepID=A0ABU6UH73_9FABA|nr:hypothetical protein [Stylosanthes scabra]
MREELSPKAAIFLRSLLQIFHGNFFKPTTIRVCCQKTCIMYSYIMHPLLQVRRCKAVDFVSDDIWFRFVQFVTNNEDLQTLKKERKFRPLSSSSSSRWGRQDQEEISETLQHDGVKMVR